ncbi:MAG: hypothetical protein KDB25_07380 [Leucobacter sp.]|nr:hypothetical protein [Leucobacter sp.]
MTWEIVPERGDARRALLTTSRTRWWLLALAGVLVAAVGVGFLIWPFLAARSILAVLLGAALIAGAIAVFARAPSGPGAVGGLLLLAGGVLAIAFAEVTAGLIVTMVSVALISIGALWLLVGLGFGRRATAAVVIPPVLLVGAGVVGLVWPAVALTVFAIVAGIGLILLGVSIVGGAFALRAR